jgi:8-oxo-dGTP pyrophosphatase MutT (NUDIX family)
MFKIVFNDKKIFLLSDYASWLKQEPLTAYILAFIPDVHQIQDLVDRLQISEIDCLLIQDDPVHCLEKFKEAFRFIQAGGGLVRNRKNEFLFIYRHKKWDLPKGKLEPSEDIRLCALREVQEETGLKELSTLELIGSTYHIYVEDTLFLKESVWYLMLAEDTFLSPQAEEGITRAIWVHPNNIRFQLEKTYESVLDLFIKLGFYQK